MFSEARDKRETRLTKSYRVPRQPNGERSLESLDLEWQGWPGMSATGEARLCACYDWTDE